MNGSEEEYANRIKSIKWHMWRRRAFVGLLLGVVAVSVFFLVVSIECNIVMDRSLTSCGSSLFTFEVASRVAPLLQYGTP